MLELNDKALMEFIKSGTVLVKAWMNNCKFCDEFAPIFAEAEKRHLNIQFAQTKINPSDITEFRKKYIIPEKGKSSGMPAIFLFQDGELVRKHHGRLFAEPLDAFIKGEALPDKVLPPDVQQKQHRIQQLYAHKGEIIHTIEMLNGKLQNVNHELARLLP